MTASGLLNTFSMAAQPIWGPRRTLRGLRIDLHPETDTPVDVGLLLRSIENAVRGPAPTLILGSRDNQLLSALMKRPAMDGMWLEVAYAQLISDEAMLASAEEALKKGWTLTCSCDASETPDEAYSFLFNRLILDLGPIRKQAKRYLADEEPPAIPQLNYQKGQIYVGADSQALIRHCLDQEHAWGMVGWPQHDMVKQSRGEAGSPHLHAVTNMVKSLDKDASIDQIETCLHQDPVLTYRFMRFVNSVAMGRQSNIDTPRRGLTLVGLTAVREWLTEQETVATRQSDLNPLRLTAVIRGILTEAMLEVGVDHELQKELYFCGLLSELDALLAEPMSAVLKRIPLRERVLSAVGGHHGVYWPALDLALAIESGQALQVSRLSLQHRVSLAQINTGILHLLTTLPSMVQVDNTQ